jgi:hypothetical protein
MNLKTESGISMTRNSIAELTYVQRRAPRLLIICGLAITCSSAFAAPTKPDYTNFSIIPDRNIFNTKRSPGVRVNSSRLNPRPRPTDSIVLTGTMHDEKGALAFFDGNAADYRQVLKTNESIAGMQVVEIQHGVVKLQNGTNEITLPVNMQIAREGQGEWQVGPRSDSSGDLAQVSTSYRSQGDSGSRSDRGNRYRNRRDGESRRSDRSQPAEVDTAAAKDDNSTTNDNPPTNVGSPPPAGASDADILEILRRRREQENNP